MQILSYTGDELFADLSEDEDELSFKIDEPDIGKKFANSLLQF